MSRRWPDIPRLRHARSQLDDAIEAARKETAVPSDLAAIVVAALRVLDSAGVHVAATDYPEFRKTIEYIDKCCITGVRVVVTFPSERCV